MIYEATILIRNGSLEEALRRQSAGNNNAPRARICSKSGLRKKLSLRRVYIARVVVPAWWWWVCRLHWRPWANCYIKYGVCAESEPRKAIWRERCEKIFAAVRAAWMCVYCNNWRAAAASIHIYNVPRVHSFCVCLSAYFHSLRVCVRAEWLLLCCSKVFVGCKKFGKGVESITPVRWGADR